MPTGSSKSRNYKLLGTKRVAEILLPFTGSGAEWYMTATQLLSRESAVPALEIVVWEAGHELGRWPLHAMAYGSLVSGLVQQPEGPFAIPHAKGFVYDEYAQVSSRLATAGQVLAELIPPYNALLYRMARTERTAGLSVSQVRSWLKQAEHTLITTKGQVLQQLMSEVGPPRYASHSSCLPDLLPTVQQGTQLLKEFLTNSLPPTSPPGARERTTVGAEESRWDWAQLSFRRRGMSSELAMKMYEYLPEIEIVYGPYKFPDEEPEIEPDAIQPLKAIEQSLESAIRTQLLDIRQRVDNLLAILD
ncbi:hypothetical protein GCM10027422_34190 [Hymenobacter arcticus]